MIINDLTHTRRATQMVLSTNMISHVLNTVLLGVEAPALRRDQAFRQLVFQYRTLADLVQPVDASGEDLGVCGLAEVAGIDARLLCWVRGLDVDTAARQGVFEAYEE